MGSDRPTPTVVVTLAAVLMAMLAATVEAADLPWSATNECDDGRYACYRGNVNDCCACATACKLPAAADGKSGPVVNYLKAIRIECLALSRNAALCLRAEAAGNGSVGSDPLQCRRFVRECLTPGAGLDTCRNCEVFCADDVASLTRCRATMGVKLCAQYADQCGRRLGRCCACVDECTATAADFDLPAEDVRLLHVWRRQCQLPGRCNRS